MTGETLGWFQLASHLHLPLQEVQAKTTSTEFLLWMKYLEDEPNHFHREDYYLAQIAVEIARSHAKNPKRIKLEDGLLKFGESKKDKKLGAKEKERQARQFFTLMLSVPSKRKLPDA